MFAVLAAFIANFLVFIGKGIVALVSGSTAMLSEAIHSLVDTVDQLLLFWGDKRSKRRADKTHPFGYGREKYFYAMVVGTLLFMIGGLYAIYNGTSKIISGHYGVAEIPIYISVGLLVFAFLVEGWAFLSSLKIARSERHAGESLWKFIKRTKSVEFIICLLEDFAAMVGCMIAIVGVSLAHFTGNYLFDVVAGCLVGVLLTIIGLVILFETKSLLLGESADPDIIANIRKYVENEKAVDKLLDLKIINLGAEEILVLIKIDLKAHFDPENAINRIEKGIRQIYPHWRCYIYVEVDDAK